MTAREEIKLSNRLFNEYYKRLVRYLTYITRNHADAEEIASSVMAKAIIHYGSYNSEIAKEFTWICEISKNTLIDYYRNKGTANGKGNKLNYSLDQTVNNDASDNLAFQVPYKGIQADLLIDQQIIRVRIESALNDLKPAYKAMAIDYFIHESKYSELVEKYELPLNNVKVSLNRIRAKLQTVLSNEYELVCS